MSGLLRFFSQFATQLGRKLRTFEDMRAGGMTVTSEAFFELLMYLLLLILVSTDFVNHTRNFKLQF
jgi:hypothetical protein